MKRHIETVHAEKTVSCELCNKCYATKNALMKHVRDVHTKGDAYKCEPCKETFKDKTDLNRHCKTKKHMKNITGQKQQDTFDCQQCEEKLIHSSLLKNHIRIVHRQKINQCETCFKQFKSASTLHNHVKIHTPLEEQVCCVNGI